MLTSFLYNIKQRLLAFIAKKFDFLHCVGKYTFIVHDSEGNLKQRLEVYNLVTTVGKALIAGRLSAVGAPAAALYIAVGTGATAAAAGDTALQAEIVDSGLERVLGTGSLTTTTTTNDTFHLTTTFTVTGIKAVTEVGILNASSSGTLLSRRVASAVNVASGDSLTVNYDLQFT